VGGFFWFVFFSVKENEQRKPRDVKPGLSPGFPSKYLSDKHRAAGKNAFNDVIWKSATGGRAIS
jgi:hypothetical protein